MKSLLEPDADTLLADESTVTMPVRVLHVVGAAAKESTKYALSSVLVETRRLAGKTDTIAIAASDGRRLVLVEMSSGLFDGNLRVQIPADVATAAIKIAVKSEEDEPMATLHTEGRVHTLNVSTPSGDGVFTWRTTDDALPFPPYRDVIPNWKTSLGIATIGINPELLAGTLKVVQKVAGAEKSTRVYLPEKPDRPLGFEATDGDGVRVIAVVMPVKIEEWTAAPPKPKSVDPHQPDLPLADQWRATPVEALGLKAKTCECLVNAGLNTIGQLADYTSKPTNRLIDLKGVGEGKVTEIDAALDKFWAAQRADGEKSTPSAAVAAPNPSPPVTDEPPGNDSIVRDDKAEMVAEFGTAGTAVDAVQLQVAPRRSGKWARRYDVYVGPEVGRTPNRVSAPWSGSYADQATATAEMIAEVTKRLGDLRGDKRGPARARIDEVLAKLIKLAPAAAGVPAGKVA